MARRGLPIRKKNGKQRRQRRAPARRRLPARNNRSANSQSLGPLVAKGIRSVLAALPGSSITTSVADFIFSAVGWHPNETNATADSAISLDSVQITGLCGGFCVDPSMFTASIPSLGLIVPKLTGNPEIALVQTQWTAARITVLKIVARPSGPLGTVSGTWAIGYTPFVEASARQRFLESIQARGINFEVVRQLPCSMMGDANKPLVLRYYHTPRDGTAYQPHVFDGSAIGMVLIAYQDMMRTAYTEITQNDFQTTIDVSCNIIFSERDPDTSVEFDNSIVTVLKTPAVVRTKNQVLTFKPEKFDCSNNRKGACKIDGTVQSVKTVRSSLGHLLEQMGVD